MIHINLSALLSSRNMTQKELSEITGIRASTISAFCNNIAVSIKMSQMESICAALDCAPDELFSIR